MKHWKKLDDEGKIPLGVNCPFKDRCSLVNDPNINIRCKHKGKEHTVPFSCASARMFEIMEKHDDQQTKV